MRPLERENKHAWNYVSHNPYGSVPKKKTIRYTRDANMWTGLERRTYIFSERGDVELDGLHIDPSVVDSPNLYLSLCTMIPSSLSLINLILLERSRRTTTWVVKLAKKLKMARLQLGNLQKKMRIISLWMMYISFFNPGVQIINLQIKSRVMTFF